MNEKGNNNNNIFSTGQTEVDKMKENLARLYNLTDEEKSEESLLQARIEEQSNLIMMLKKRADEYMLRCQVLDRENKDLESKLAMTNDRNKTDDKKNRILYQNYNKLLQTYEDMKEEYESVKNTNQAIKSQTEKLKIEIASLREQLTNASIDNNVKEDLSNEKNLNQQLQTTIKHLNEKYTEKSAKKTQEIKSKQDIIDSLNTQLKEKEINLNDIRISSQLSVEKLKMENDVSLNEIKNLKTILDSQTSLIKKNDNEIFELKKKSKNYENLYKELKEKYQRESDSINVNVQIQKLKSDLQMEEMKIKEMRQEHEAYKIHSNKLLQTEKELNSRLRKLYS